jgi:hypothetical protein
VTDVGDVDGHVFLAMELMKCPTLEEVLSRRRRLVESKAVLFIRQAAQALDKARDAGMFHGDLSPRNAFVASEERVRLSDFALGTLLQEPPSSLGAAAQGPAAGDDGWAGAEALLGPSIVAPSGARLGGDFVGLATLMMQMYGIDVPAGNPGEELDAYRAHLIETAFAEAGQPEAGVSPHVLEVIRRLLTAGGFESPGEVVVELAGAMLLRRSRPRAGAATPAAATAPEGETAISDEEDGAGPGEEEEEVVAEEEEEPQKAVARGRRPAGGLTVLEFRGDPRDGAYTPFFIWSDRHGGRFFVIYDGEQLAVGRDPDVADVVLMDPAISRRHCILSKDGNTITLEDLGSTNGTVVNEKRVTGTVVLEAGDRVRVGATRLYMSLPRREI